MAAIRRAPNAANYDESKANPYPNLPDPLVLKNGRKVTKPDVWWNSDALRPWKISIVKSMAGSPR